MKKISKLLHKIIKIGNTRSKNRLPIHPVQLALREIVKSNDFVVIQIGSYIGNTANDPLFDFLQQQKEQIYGCIILVEPVKYFFDQLVKNYQDIPNVFFENVAISNRSGPSKFYRLNADPATHGYPEWLSQLGSLKKDRMEILWDRYENNKDYKEFYMKYMIEDVVDCITLSDLLIRYKIPKIDLLQIDTEGFELEILKTINFGQIPIRFVNYESVLLYETKKEAEDLMRNNGFELVDYEQDTFCYRQNDSYWIKYGSALSNK